MPLATWNRSRDGDFKAKVDVDVNIDGLIHDVFTTTNMLHDEVETRNCCVCASASPSVSQTISRFLSEVP
ncbi:unnamed protein product [Sphagnum balticum]